MAYGPHHALSADVRDPVGASITLTDSEYEPDYEHSAHRGFDRSTPSNSVLLWCSSSRFRMHESLDESKMS